MKWEGGQLRRKVGQSLGMGKSYTRARIGESSEAGLRAGRTRVVCKRRRDPELRFPARAGRQVLRVILAVCFEPRKEESEGAAAKVDGC